MRPQHWSFHRRETEDSRENTAFLARLRLHETYSPTWRDIFWQIASHDACPLDGIPEENREAQSRMAKYREESAKPRWQSLLKVKVAHQRAVRQLS